MSGASTRVRTRCGSSAGQPSGVGALQTAGVWYGLYPREDEVCVLSGSDVWSGYLADRWGVVWPVL